MRTIPGNRLPSATTLRPGAQLLGLLTIAAAALAQSPAPGNEPPKEATVALQTLDSLSNAGIHVLQSLQAGTPRSAQDKPQEPVPPAAAEARQGTSTARLWARVRDVRFHRDGHVLAMLVEPATPDPRGADDVRVLPCAAVRWDASRRLWVLAEANLQFAELKAAAAAKPVAAPATVPATVQEPFLASQLGRAKIEPQSTGGAVPPSYWFAPDAQRLAFVVVPVDILTANGERAVKHVPLPWSAVRVVATGGDLQLSLATQRELLLSAPACANAAEPALFVPRHRSYAHFGVAVPGWDPAPQTPATPRK